MGCGNFTPHVAYISHTKRCWRHLSAGQNVSIHTHTAHAQVEQPIRWTTYYVGVWIASTLKNNELLHSTASGMPESALLPFGEACRSTWKELSLALSLWHVHVIQYHTMYVPRSTSLALVAGSRFPSQFSRINSSNACYCPLDFSSVTQCKLQRRYQFCRRKTITVPLMLSETLTRVSLSLVFN